MEKRWTNQQLYAIYATDGSVLVSAAAGSGKTAVLVERVINLITRKENPIDVDRLLIVTFTRAAAAEMRTRLSNALSKKLENDPYNPRLLRQKQLIYNASICTTDSFCGDLVREYFHSLNIPRDFRIADEGELKICKAKALDSAMDKYYKCGSASFLKLVNAFSSKEGDSRLREVVLTIAKFLSTQPFPEAWLDNMLGNYRVNNISDSIWGKIIIDYSQSAISHAINLSQNSIKTVSEDDKLYKALLPHFESDIVFLQSLQKQMLNGSWDDISRLLHTYKASTLRAPNEYTNNPLKLAAASNRNEVKKTISELSAYFDWSEAEAQLEIQELQRLIETLFELVKDYLNELSQIQEKKNILSFADIEQLTVKLLAVPNENGYTKTAQANDISSRYDMVIVDEFQDVNDVQNIIFNCVSTDENNIFVVGDVKQSIYGFRQAKPQIFIDRRNSCNRFDESNPKYPAAIFLDKNFRSRKEVCSAINFIFSKLMLKETARMDYTKDEYLNVGAVYPESENCDFEIKLIDKKNTENVSSEELEARFIANKIHKMIADGFTVTQDDSKRKATYGDFAIILRSPKKIASIYVNTLISLGIPAFCEIKENFYDSTEIKIMLNLLRVINNPTLDIPLLSVMCSPLYGFNPDELAQLRADNRYVSLYSAVLRYSEKSTKAADFVQDIKTLQMYSHTCGIDDLIGKIYESTSFMAITSAINGNNAPPNNLNILREYARAYQSNGYKTLSDFISYMDKLIENKVDIPSALSDSKELNGVQIISIHKSKGLEFPVCFIANMAHQFNKNDFKDDVLVDSKAGIGIRRKEGICRFNTLPRLAVSIELSRNLVAEEMRLLYVALTRAKKKLIVVSTVSDAEKYISKLYSKLVFTTIIEPYTIITSNCYSDWIMLCALTHPSFNAVRRNIDSSAKMLEENDVLPWDFEIITVDDETVDDIPSNIISLETAEEQIENDKYYENILSKNLSFSYRNADIMSLPQKVTASEVAHSKNKYFERILSKPKFLKEQDTTAVERGTAHHIFLQYCNFVNARDNIDDEIERLCAAGRLTSLQAQSIDRTKLAKLIEINLFDRIINAESVYKEEQFFAQISPSVISDEYTHVNQKASIIVQGAVDLAFVENGELVIVDYKTDRVKDIEKLAKLYEKQLLIYKAAMQQTTQLPVKQCIICSLELNDCITIE